MTFDFNIFAGQPLLPTIWFVAIGIFWIGYLILDSFDLGVGMLMSIFAKNEKERRLLLNTIGPVWMVMKFGSLLVVLPPSRRSRYGTRPYSQPYIFH